MAIQKRDGLRVSDDGDGAVAHVYDPAQIPGVALAGEVNNISTTKTTLTFASGALYFGLRYVQNADSGAAASTAGGYVSVVLNAASDADADGKLALAGARMRVPLGHQAEWIFPVGGEPLSRVDIVAPEAETGATLIDWWGVVR